MDLRQEALKHLYQEPVKNAPLLNLINHNLYSKIYIEGDAVAVKQDKYEGWVYLNQATPRNIIRLINKIKFHERLFAAVEEWTLFEIKNHFNVVWENSYFGMALPGESFVFKESHSIHPLRPEHSEMVNQYWPFHNRLSLSYIQRRIATGLSGAVYLNHQPVSWCITQDDGALGFMHTMKRYRRNGYSESAARYVIGKIRETNGIPFMYIGRKHDNSNSLAKKLGFSHMGNVAWIEIE